MADLLLDSHRLHYEVLGSDGPWITFCNSLGTDLHMWDAQAAELSRGYRILRYDRRGHGGSGSSPEPYSLDDLAGDVISMLDAVGVERTHFIGLSLGGLVGQHLAVYAAHRIDRMVVCATAMKVGTRTGWEARMGEVRATGLASLRDATSTRWFTEAFRASQPEEVARVLETFVNVDANAYVGCCDALAHADMTATLTRTRVPVLAVSGDDDPVCTPADLQAIADATGGRHVSLPGRHLVNMESADAFNAVVEKFLRAR